jgi:hypothetical protein
VKSCELWWEIGVSRVRLLGALSAYFGRKRRSQITCARDKRLLPQIFSVEVKQIKRLVAEIAPAARAMEAKVSVHRSRAESIRSPYRRARAPVPGTHQP